MSEKPNVIFVVVDALCFDSLHRRVGDRWVMPHLRKLAETDNAWDNVYSLAPYTEAALVSLLGGTRTMERGGYFFGNAGCDTPMMERYHDAGYRTFMTYSPYVYSKAYLRGVTDMVYTRHYSILPLFMYRLDSFSDALDRGILTDQQFLAAVVLIGEALDTWWGQVEAVLQKKPSAALIASEYAEASAQQTMPLLVEHKRSFENDPMAYTRKVLQAGRNHELVALSAAYNKKAPLPLLNEAKRAYQGELERCQELVSEVTRSVRLDWPYLFSTLRSDKGGLEDFRGLLSRFREYKHERLVAGYLDSLGPDSKVEASAPRQLSCALQWMAERDAEGSPFVAYLQMLDFHLPSVFHTVDSEDWSEVSEEIQEAIGLLESIDEGYSGNILTDLSAYYVDQKIGAFLDQLDEELHSDYVLVVTADHGFPCYDDPPRPYIYNQTYSEAFHVPFLVRVRGRAPLPEVEKGPVSNLEFLNALAEGVLFDVRGHIGEGYVISEYGGPGCPDMTDKEVWYTYIDGDCRISAECKLSEPLGARHVKAVMDLRSDPEEKHNLVRSLDRVDGLSAKLERLKNRHEMLRGLVPSEEFWTVAMSAPMVREDIAQLREGGIGIA